MVQITCEELNSVWAIKKRIEREKRRIKDLQILAESITPILDGMPHAKPLTFKVEKIAMEKLACEQLISELSVQMIQDKFDLLTKIQSRHLNELQERVLSYHYVSCLCLNEISKTMNYSRRYIEKLLTNGLIALGLSVEMMNEYRKAS